MSVLDSFETAVGLVMRSPLQSVVRDSLLPKSKSLVNSLGDIADKAMGVGEAEAQMMPMNQAMPMPIIAPPPTGFPDMAQPPQPPPPSDLPDMIKELIGRPDINVPKPEEIDIMEHDVPVTGIAPERPQESVPDRPYEGQTLKSEDNDEFFHASDSGEVNFGEGGAFFGKSEKDVSDFGNVVKKYKITPKNKAVFDDQYDVLDSYGHWLTKPGSGKGDDFTIKVDKYNKPLIKSIVKDDIKEGDNFSFNINDPVWYKLADTVVAKFLKTEGYDSVQYKSGSFEGPGGGIEELVVFDKSIIKAQGGESVNQQLKDKTIDNLIKAKATGKDKAYYNEIELVNVNDLYPFKEYDRSKFPNTFGKDMENLKKSIKENGIKDPIVLDVNANGEMIVTEGNNRLEIARELGIKYVPTRVVRNSYGFSKRQNALPINKISLPDSAFYAHDPDFQEPRGAGLKASMSPSEIGLKTLNVKAQGGETGLKKGSDDFNTESIESIVEDLKSVAKEYSQKIEKINDNISVEEIPFSKLNRIKASEEDARFKKLEKTGITDYVTVIKEGNKYRPVDGQHRIALAEKQGKASLKMIVANSDRNMGIKEILSAINPFHVKDAEGAEEQLPKNFGMNSVALMKGDIVETEASTYGWDEKLEINTADGKKFNPNGKTAAMWNMPFGTKIKVTDKKTGKTVIVEVNDRGPAKRLEPKRSIDLSKGAWKALGYDKPALINVELEMVK